MRDIHLIDLMTGVSKALDYVSPDVTGHHRRVALASVAIGSHLGIGTESLTDMLMAGLLHDIGAFSMDLKLDGLDFDADLTEHAVAGHRLLRGYPFLERASRMVLYHHTKWSDLRVVRQEGDRETLLMANIINLADRVDILRRVGSNGFSRDRVRETVRGYTDQLYAPEIIDAFMVVSSGGVLWQLMENMEGSVRDILGEAILNQLVPQGQLLAFSDFFSHIIDFRSRHTATHSQGVAETAVQLARLAGMSEDDQQRMRLAGNLHDIGKLAVSTHLLDKPGKLDSDEYSAVQDHASVCEQVLQSITGLDEVAEWACQHHERLNGKGYPHGLKEEELSLGSRIMQVADVHTAITEDRPYRKGMEKDQALAVLRSMVTKGFLDVDIVQLVIDHYDQIDAVRRIVQSRALADFKRFTELNGS